VLFLLAWMVWIISWVVAASWSRAIRRQVTAEQAAVTEASGGKPFFFEKKNQKTLINWCSRHPERPQPNQSTVFCCFLSKDTSFLPRPPAADAS
jgi:hypothetical protein